MCDFGFARFNEIREARALTLCGTDDWMAPEVILGMDYNEKADVFSYGIVVLEIITRKKVSVSLQRSAADGFELDVEKTKAVLPSDCPESFSDLAFEVCAYDPEARPTFKQVVSRLSKLYKTYPNNTAPRGRGGRGRGGRGGRGAPRGRGMRGRGRGGPGSPQRGRTTPPRGGTN